MTVPLNIAHRGGAQLWPENTLFAFARAARAGYGGAELDVQLTRDDKLVVFHDFALKPELCRDSRGRWIGRSERAPVRELSFAELRSFDVGRPKPRTLYARRHRRLIAHDGERVPSPAVECWFSTRRYAHASPHTVKEAGGDGWFCPVGRASASVVRQAQALGLRVGVWTVDRPRDLRRLVSLGVDAICTDRPDRLQHISGTE
jgi:glycerophosphoryl diester phosphodiesterase